MQAITGRYTPSKIKYYFNSKLLILSYAKLATAFYIFTRIKNSNNFFFILKKGFHLFSWMYTRIRQNYK